MSLISDFQYNLQADPEYRKKIIFGVFGTIGIFSLIGLMIWSNFRGGNGQATTADTTQTPVVNVATPKTEIVTNQSFTSSQELEQVDSEGIRYNTSLLALQNGTLAYIDTNGLARLDKNSVKTPTQYNPSILHEAKEGLIINEPTSSSILTPINTIAGFKNNAYQVIPVYLQATNLNPIQSYYFLNDKDGKTFLGQASKQDLSDAKDVYQVILEKEKEYLYTEMRQIGVNIFIIGYTRIDQKGDVDIYIVGQNSVEKKLGLTGVESLKYGKNSMLVTKSLEKPTDLTLYTNDLYDFASAVPTYKPNSLDISTKLGTDGVYGNLFASRCGFDTKADLYCLVKKDKVPYTDFTGQDSLIKITTNSQKVEYLLKNNVFSGGGVYVSFTDELYIIGQENKLIYRVKK